MKRPIVAFMTLVLCALGLRAQDSITVSAADLQALMQRVERLEQAQANFEGKKVRIVWDEQQEKYWFSVVDIVQVLTGSFDYQQARKYWKVLKGR